MIPFHRGIARHQESPFQRHEVVWPVLWRHQISVRWHSGQRSCHQAQPPDFTTHMVGKWNYSCLLAFIHTPWHRGWGFFTVWTGWSWVCYPFNNISHAHTRSCVQEHICAANQSINQSIDRRCTHEETLSMPEAILLLLEGRVKQAHSWMKEQGTGWKTCTFKGWWVCILKDIHLCKS